MPDGQTVLITGGGGFIGSKLVARLVDRNRITVFDTFQRDALRTSSLADHPNLRIIEGDVRDAAAVTEALRGQEVVIHCAAIAGTDSVTRSPIKTFDVNFGGTARVLEAAVGLRQLILFSTSEVYGSHAANVGEGDPCVVGAPGERRWTYAASKLAAEHLAMAYHQERNIPITVVRPFNVYGPGQIGEGAIQIFCRQALLDEPITINGDGSQIRAWTYVDDMVDGVVLALGNPAAVGRVFNIGNDARPISTTELANLVVELSASRSQIEFRPAPTAEVQVRIPVIDRARALLGFEPRVDLDEGINATLGWLRDRLESA
jgi:UDP-glucose 4-epimerase